jgi:TRAP transporter TAXI family solute receptor
LDINLLEVDKEPMEKFMEKVSDFRLITIPAGTYKGVDREVLTGASPALLIARGDLDEEVVYKITKAIFEHLEDLRGIHAQADNISLEGALQAMSILCIRCGKILQRSGLLNKHFS